MRKHLTYIFIFVFLLIATGCIGNNSEGLTLVGGKYRAQWEEGYRYDTPILIDSYQEWLEFLEKHPAQSDNEDVLNQDFSHDFFKDHLIYAYIKSEASGSNTLTVKGAERKGDSLHLSMERHVPAEGTDDLAARICVFGFKREEVKGINEVEASTTDRNP